MKLKTSLRWVVLLISAIIAVIVLIRIPIPFACFLCDRPHCSALRLVDLQAGEVLDLELSANSETFSLLSCGEATGYRLSDKCEISLEDRGINGTRQKLCHSCQKLIPKEYSGRYILLLMDGGAAEKTLCLDENTDYSFFNYRISVVISENCKELLITTTRNTG